MPDWLVDPSMQHDDPWPSSMRSRAEAAADRVGLGADAVRVLLGAAVIDSIVQTATRLTVNRPRIQHDGNTLRAADDPQFVEVLRETSGLAVTAVSAAERMLSGALDHVAVQELQFGMRAIAERVLSQVFDTLGASATLERHRLHQLRAASTALWSEIESAEPLGGYTQH